MPPVRYARSGTVNVAYQVTGEGPGVDLVLAPIGTLDASASRAARGVHTAEVERAGPAIRGINVAITARIRGVAAADEVVTSSTLRDLCAGFRHPLRGSGNARAQRCR